MQRNLNWNTVRQCHFKRGVRGCLDYRKQNYRRSLSQRKAIADVIHVRVAELFEIISKELGPLLNADELKGGILLTGGGSRLPGVETVATQVLGQTVRKATFPPGITPELAQPENATVLGLLHYGLEDHSLPGQKKPEQEVGILGKLGRIVGIGPTNP